MELNNMKIAVASGKGGTGKTTVAVNLAYYLNQSQQRVQYIDCDVEEPNGHLFLKPHINSRSVSRVMVPAINIDRCTFCGDCGAKCHFHAIVNLPSDTLVFPELCHSCGLCALVCPEGAITEGAREIGMIEEGVGIKGIQFVHGILRIGEPMAVPLVRMVKQKQMDNHIRIIDAPPGTSCPVVATLADSDAVVMVTEPTPFGLHDLKIAVSVTKLLGIPLGIVINRARDEFYPLTEYLKENDLAILTSIPEDKQIAKVYAEGSIVLESLPQYLDNYIELVGNLGLLAGLTGDGRAAWKA